MKAEPIAEIGGPLALGLDVGSVGLAAAVVGADGKARGRLYVRHGGDLEAALARVDAELDMAGVEVVALTGRRRAELGADAFYESRVASLESIRRRYPKAGAVLVVGGEEYWLARFDGSGEYRGAKSNSGCAAGTGGFLDQQAGRLGLTGSAELSALAGSNLAEPPKVATRCAVFAKTDLIHAQQEGHALAAIADGLCSGLSRNIVDALFGEPVAGPVVFSGGVALNDAVLEGLGKLTGLQLIRDDEALYRGAIGAASLLLADGRRTGGFKSARAVRRAADLDRDGFYPPLRLELSTYPDFGSHRSYVKPTRPRGGRPGLDVEVDSYAPTKGLTRAWLGLDVGSTSTKAALVGDGGAVIAGFYTRTSGRPLEAFQAVLEAIDGLTADEGMDLDLVGFATTGSGRKFVGSLAGADLALDEISAHARAAVELDSEVDTIIEIGGQDSKFTTLKDGRVTSSIMNNVCAAGTGSFVEEQAGKLGVALSDYASLTDGVRAPRVSDRCTVFMERDLNHLLSDGCSVPEALAAALHAVRENYLRKVAVGKTVGSTVFFQGATAKNRSLVAAFEQALGKPMIVSRYCHLTGAIGAALSLRDAGVRSTSFKGVSLHERDIPVRSEVCGLCANHCKLSVASVGGDEVAFGFLCGRDYATKKYVAKEAGAPRLAALRAEAERRALAEIGLGGAAIGSAARDRTKAANPARPGAAVALGAAGAPRALPARPGAPTIGLPAALSLVDELGFWKVFFGALGFPVLAPEGKSGMVAAGKERMGAEFCAPMASYFGHALSMLDEADYVFAPFHLERLSGKAEGKRLYCYSTQFASPLAFQRDGRNRLLRPIVEAGYTAFKVKEELRRCLTEATGLAVRYEEVSEAWDQAERFGEARARALSALFAESSKAGSPQSDDIEVAIVGRPYSVLPAGMNKGIPDMFAERGVRTWFMDMVGKVPEGESAIVELERELPWQYGKEILKAAEKAATTPDLYPVLVTSFKCGPDSFVVDAFKKAMDAYGKPYLVLELDEHDSAVGYETRVEAAMRSFRNHRQGERERAARAVSAPPLDSPPAPAPSAEPRYASSLKGKTLFLPFWDDLAAPLLAASLRASGVDAVVMEETDATIRLSVSTNSGQCLPLNAIAEAFVHTVGKLGLDPADCAVWMVRSVLACNIPMYPHKIKGILEERGGGFERSSVYVGDLSFMEISPLAAVDAYQAYLFAGLVRRLACRIRPYELVQGMTDAVVARSLELLVPIFEDRRKSKVKAAEDIVSLFEAIPFDRTMRKPLVALFGDFYVRDNRVMNQDVIRAIEDGGGEVISMPYNQYAKMIADTYFSRWFKEGRYGDVLKFNALLAASKILEKAYYRVFDRVLEEADQEFDDSAAEILARYGVLVENAGESAENLLKTWYVKKHFPDVSLFVQLSPVFCCAALVTEAMSSRIEEVTGVPVVSLTYDGTGGGKNDALAPYLRYPRKPSGGRASPAGGKPQAGVAIGGGAARTG